MQADLGTWRVGGPTALSLVVPALHEALRTDSTASYVFVAKASRIVMGEIQGENIDIHRARTLLDALTQSDTIRWAAYNALRPEPWQRNRIVTMRQLQRRTDETLEAMPIMKRVLGPLGFGHHDQMRMLVCEGPSLLAWVGAWQPDPFDARQRALLAAIGPTLRRRLRLERSLASMPRTLAALGVALEALGAPAFITSRSGQIFEANKAGRALHERNPRTLVAALRDSAARRPTGIRFAMTPIEGTGEGATFLAIAQTDTRESRLSSAISAVSSRWKLTPRQTEVLDLVGRGVTNRTIAAALAISESTVEFHLATIFERAGVETRAALIALFIGRE
jgi:DNA-binding CsgD family transcriptional regulator/PAS domain-containing protein